MSRRLRHVCRWRLADDENSRWSISLLYWTNLSREHRSGKPIRDLRCSILTSFFGFLFLCLRHYIFARVVQSIKGYSRCLFFAMLSDLHILTYTYDYMLMVPPLFFIKRERERKEKKNMSYQWIIIMIFLWTCTWV